MPAAVALAPARSEAEEIAAKNKTTKRKKKEERIMAANILTDQKLEKNTNLDPEEDEFNGGIISALHIFIIIFIALFLASAKMERLSFLICAAPIKIL